MRILFVPVFNYPNNLNADSIYLISGDWCRALCEADENISIYRLLPEPNNLEDKFKKFIYRYEPVHPRVHDIFVPMYSRYDMEEVNCPIDTFKRFHPVLGEFPVDAVITTSAIKTVFVKRILLVGGGETYPPAFFNFELLMRSNYSNEVSKVSDDELMLQSAGETMGYNLLESPMCRRMAITTAKSFVAPSLIKGIIKNSALVFSGYNETFDPATIVKNERFTLMLRGRLTGSKHVDQILDLYNKFYAAGRKIDIQITTGDVMMRSLVTEELIKNDAIQVLRLESREEALRVMEKAHAFLFWSSHELFAVSVWEMLAAGLIGVFKREDWHKGLLPDDYPYQFDTFLEAYQMLSHIYENYDKVKEELAWVPGWVKERYHYENTTRTAAKIIRDNVPTRKPRGWLPEMMIKHGKDEMTLIDAMKVIEENSEMGKSILAGYNPSRVHRSVGISEIANALEQNGYYDVLTDRQPMYKKRATNENTTAVSGELSTGESQ